MSAEPIGAFVPPQEPGTPITPYRPAPLTQRRPVLVSDPPRQLEDTRPRPLTPHTPPPDSWARTLVVALAEVLVGARPARQLNRWLDPGAYARVARRAGLAARLGGRPESPARARLLGLRLTEPAPDQYEVSAVVHDGARVRAIALRMRRSGERWHVADAEIG